MIRRIAPIVIAVAVAAAPLAAAPQDTSAQAPKQASAAKPSPILASVQGVWVMTQVNGQDTAGAGQEITITIKDSTYTQAVNGQITEKGTFRIDDSKKPMTIDIAIVEGDDAGGIQLGLVEITGNSMKGKLSDPGGARPADFNVADGYFVFVMVKK